MIQKVWKVYTTQEDGYTQMDLVGHFSDSADAQKAARGRGYYDGDGKIISTSIVTVGDKYFEIDEKKPVMLNVDLIFQQEELKRTALEKLKAANLSKDEQDAIGITILIDPN